MARPASGVTVIVALLPYAIERAANVSFSRLSAMKR
jgi:hypothetical protein